jgi:hypothetical protein
VAKGSDKLAGAAEAGKSGLLPGLLAEENEFDHRSLWRIGTWGVAAVGAVVLAVAANQSSLGWRRERLVAADLTRQAQQMQSLAKESQNETRRLASAIDTLNGDRDRLFSRVTVLEQGLDLVTSAISRQTAAATSVMSAQPKPMPPPSAMPGAITPPPVVGADNSPSSTVPPQNQAAAPVIAPATTAAPAATEKPRTQTAKTDPAPAENASLPQIASNKSAATPLPGAIAPAPGTQAAQASIQPSGQAIGTGKSIMGPPDPGAPKMVEAARTADKTTDKTAGAVPVVTPSPLVPASDASAAPPKEQEKKDQEKAVVDADSAKATIQRTEFAVELGGANSIGGLRALWRGLLKSNNAELAELRPIIVVREGNTGLGMQLRLAAGPLHDAAEAAKICAALVESDRNCETTVFDGQRLAMGAEEGQPGANGRQPPAAASGRSTITKRYPPRHTKKEDLPPPPKETSTFSSLFGGGKR